MPDEPAFGVWAVDKPAGPTSHDVIARIRRSLGREVKVGHAGTLDPFATGLLLVLVGRATRLMQYVVGHDKAYRARVRFGITSATGDPEGPLQTTDGQLPGPTDVRRALELLEGVRTQRVPVYAAVRVDGERMHRRARRGESVERPTRPISITSSALLAMDESAEWADIELTCSSGTYVRQVAVDLGEHLGCGAYCEALRRLSVGQIGLDHAVAPDDVRPQGGIDPRVALAPMPERVVSDVERDLVLHGRALEARGEHQPTMLVADGKLVAIAEPAIGGTLHPKVVLV